MLAIAIAFAYEPALLIADEPTSSLDPITIDENLDLIERTLEGRSISIGLQG